MSEPKIGVLLMNIGSPEEPTSQAVRSYLRRFLSDPRVIDAPAPIRWMILNFFILPFRPPKVALKYEEIWTEEGSPLMVHSRKLAEEVEKTLGEKYLVRLGMRYSEPSIQNSIQELMKEGVERIIAFPLFPQYASATTGSAIEETFRILKDRWEIPPITTISPFYNHEFFHSAFAKVAEPYLKEKYDHVLFSFHGLPENHLVKEEPCQSHCFHSSTCCEEITPRNLQCYRAQCFATARNLTKACQISADKTSVSFQSRLGRAEWIKPYTTNTLVQLAKEGKKRLLVFCPSFVADCLETVEEIGITETETFLSAGGELLTLIPSLNSEDSWITAVAQMILQK